MIKYIIGGSLIAIILLYILYTRTNKTKVQSGGAPAGLGFAPVTDPAVLEKLSTKIDGYQTQLEQINKDIKNYKNSQEFKELKEKKKAATTKKQFKEIKKEIKTLKENDNNFQSFKKKRKDLKALIEENINKRNYLLK